jgi:hypothetical protein
MGRTREQEEREARWGWRLLGLFALALVVTLVTVFFINIRPLRRQDGRWTWVRVATVRWPQSGFSTREYEDFEDVLLRREWDVDGDGRFECREEACPGRAPLPESLCVFERQAGRWVQLPPEVASCTELSRLRAPSRR